MTQDATNRRASMAISTLDDALSFKKPTSLFGLPRELRDIIYEYALTEEGGVAIDRLRSNKNRLAFRKANLCMTKAGCSTYSRDRDFATSFTEIHEPNQLRYVCRQLCQETSGLSTLYNDIYISEDWVPDNDIYSGRNAVYNLFDNFIDFCSSGSLAGLRRVVIYDSGDSRITVEPVPDLRKLSSTALVPFCRSDPNVTVIVRFNWVYTWPDDDEEFLLAEMIGISLVVRKIDPFPMYQMEDNDLFGDYGSYDYPENLRVSVTHYLGPHSVELGLRNLACGNENMEICRKIVHEMHENGI